MNRQANAPASDAVGATADEVGRDFGVKRLRENNAQLLKDLDVAHEACERSTRQLVAARSALMLLVQKIADASSILDSLDSETLTANPRILEGVDALLCGAGLFGERALRLLGEPGCLGEDAWTVGEGVLKDLANALGSAAAGPVGGAPGARMGNGAAGLAQVPAKGGAL